jgi:hypothetical protein
MEPPITINLDASADIEPLPDHDDGGPSVAISNSLVRVELSALLAERLSINIANMHRRANQASA